MKIQKTQLKYTIKSKNTGTTNVDLHVPGSRTNRPTCALDTVEPRETVQSPQLPEERRARSCTWIPWVHVPIPVPVQYPDHTRARSMDLVDPRVCIQTPDPVFSITRPFSFPVHISGLIKSQIELFSTKYLIVYQNNFLSVFRN
jgi:hypothetical protein